MTCAPLSVSWGDGTVDAGVTTTGLVTENHTYNEVGNTSAWTHCQKPG